MGPPQWKLETEAIKEDLEGLKKHFSDSQTKLQHLQGLVGKCLSEDAAAAQFLSKVNIVDFDRRNQEVNSELAASKAQLEQLKAAVAKKAEVAAVDRVDEAVQKQQATLTATLRQLTQHSERLERNQDFISGNSAQLTVLERQLDSVSAMVAPSLERKADVSRLEQLQNMTSDNRAYIEAIERRQERMETSLRDKADVASMERHLQMASEARSERAALERRLDQLSTTLSDKPDMKWLGQHEQNQQDMIASNMSRLNVVESKCEILDNLLGKKVDYDALARDRQQLSDATIKDFALRADVIWWLESQTTRLQDQINGLRSQCLEKEGNALESLASKAVDEAITNLREELGSMVRAALLQERQALFQQRFPSKDTGGRLSKRGSENNPQRRASPNVGNQCSQQSVDTSLIFPGAASVECARIGANGRLSPTATIFEELTAMPKSGGGGTAGAGPGAGQGRPQTSPGRAAEVEAMRKEAGVAEALEVLPSVKGSVGAPGTKRQPNTARKPGSPRAPSSPAGGLARRTPPLQSAGYK